MKKDDSGPKMEWAKHVRNTKNGKNHNKKVRRKAKNQLREDADDAVIKRGWGNT